MTELSFLIELLLNHELTKATKDLIAERIKEVEQGISAYPRARETPIVPSGPRQAPSMMAIMEKHGDITAQLPPNPITQTVVMEKARMDTEAILSRAKNRPITTR